MDNAQKAIMVGVGLFITIIKRWISYDLRKSKTRLFTRFRTRIS